MIEVIGTYQGEKVTVGWDDGKMVGPIPAIDAVIEASAEMLGRTFVASNGDRITDPLSDPRTFVYAAFQALDDPQTDWEEPDGLPDGEIP